MRSYAPNISRRVANCNIVKNMHATQRNRISPISRPNLIVWTKQRDRSPGICGHPRPFLRRKEREKGGKRKRDRENKLETVNFYSLIVWQKKEKKRKKRKERRKKKLEYAGSFRYFPGNERTLSTDFARSSACNAPGIETTWLRTKTPN